MRSVLRLCVSLVALALTSGTASGAIVNIDVFDFDFGIANPPQHVNPTIQINDTIRWTFVNTNHSTTSVANSGQTWNSGVIFTVGATFDHIFTLTGSFHYFCIPHGFDNGDGTAGGMSGIIHVVPEPTAILALAVGAFVAGAAARRVARSRATGRGADGSR